MLGEVNTRALAVRIWKDSPSPSTCAMVETGFERGFGFSLVRRTLLAAQEQEAATMHFARVEDDPSQAEHFAGKATWRETQPA